MRMLGSILMGLGILVGLLLGAFVFAGSGAFGLSWLAGILVGKLTFLGAIGLLGTGAVLHRLDRRRSARELLDRARDEAPM